MNFGILIRLFHLSDGQQIHEFENVWENDVGMDT